MPHCAIEDFHFLHLQYMHEIRPDEALLKLEQLLDRIALYLFMDCVWRALSGFGALLRLEED